MGKFAADEVLDGAFAVVAKATRLIAVNGQPASYSAAHKGRLAEASMSGADFICGPGDFSGRKVTIAAKPKLSVIAAGTADHVALVDDASQRLLYVTTCPAGALSDGGEVSIAAWSIEIEAPR